MHTDGLDFLCQEARGFSKRLLGGTHMQPHPAVASTLAVVIRYRYWTMEHSLFLFQARRQQDITSTSTSTQQRQTVAAYIQ